MQTTTVEEMLRHVARFAALRGSEEAFVDSRLPGCRRRKINIIGNGVVERTDLPDLQPNIALAEYKAPDNMPAETCPFCKAGVPITTF